MIPNAQSFLSSLPGIRVTAVSGGVTAALCIREAVRKMGNLSDGGLSAQPYTRLLFLRNAFGSDRDIADLIRVDGVPAAIITIERIVFDQIFRADCVLMSDTCTFDGATLVCQINAVSQTSQMFTTGIQGDETETLTTHVELLPEGGKHPAARDPITMPDGSRRSILHVSTDNTGRVLCIHTQRKGAQAA